MVAKAAVASSNGAISGTKSKALQLKNATIVTLTWLLTLLGFALLCAYCYFVAKCNWYVHDEHAYVQNGTSEKCMAKNTNSNNNNDVVAFIDVLNNTNKEEYQKQQQQQQH